MNHLSQNQGKKRLNTHTKDRALHMKKKKKKGNTEVEFDFFLDGVCLQLRSVNFKLPSKFIRLDH